MTEQPYKANEPNFNLSYDVVKELVKGNQVVVIDVRTSQEHSAGHVHGAINIDVDSQLETALKLSQNDFKTTYGVERPAKEESDKMVFHCRSGNRSRRAMQLAHQLGYVRARHYLGGYDDWVKREKGAQ